MSAEPARSDAEIAKALRLRATPIPVAKISRRALMAASAIVLVGIFGAVGWSMRERVRPAPKPAEVAVAATPSERVTALPKGYTGSAAVPVLGPPLPGDLGRPILAAQRAQGADGAGGGVDGAPALAPVAARPPVEPALDTRTAVRRAAAPSDLFVAGAPGRGVTRGASPLAAGISTPQDPRTTSLERLQAPASPYLLQAGTVIPAALITGLSSDTPGVAVAQVTQDVHDSLGGGYLLIPAGARLVGTYEAAIKTGQSRLSVVWTRLILPSGRSVVLDSLPGVDLEGMAGLQDQVDRHGDQILAAGALSTLLAIGAQSGSSSDESDLVRALRRGGADAVTDVGRQVVGRSLERAPTLRIRPGTPLRVLLTKDLVLEPYAGGDRE
ncbi:type IV secretion system protein VirB10 [Caulobacter sp. BE264]|uniref:TrbI/VirB10 family protein n=1 Tax=Caulobacter sp. BE264 TaxID=2817724 RepID=UPI00286418F1|nr:TrbI/VirB10 family protein [Caulobacter sp. BE264]MDR7229878.1 type IV secretion system protein VirB10 [Caulobacter sp. BE264]